MGTSTAKRENQLRKVFFDNIDYPSKNSVHFFFAKAFLENFIYLHFWSVNKTHLLNFVTITPLPHYSAFLLIVGLINKYTVYNFGKS